MWKFPEDLFITRLYSSGVLRYAETNSDIDGYNKTKYTKKGPNSLGGKNSNNISIRYRGIHPSFLGNIDLLVCGNSDQPRSVSIVI